MYRIALALTVVLAGCAHSPTSLETCGFMAESSRLNAQPARISRSEKARWLDEVGLSTRGYRATYWYQGEEAVRLVCLYKSRCEAEVHAYRKNGTGWQQFEPPDHGILCITGA
jgi:hypothetical protein